MTQLHQISVSLSEGQKRNLTRAYNNREEVRLRLSRGALSGPDVLAIPMGTVNRLAKAKAANKGMVITISKNNIRRQTGSGIFSSLMPFLKTVAPTVGKALGLSALAGAASEGGSQLIKNISGGQLFSVPNKNLYMLAQMGDLLTKAQKGDLARAHQAGNDLLFKITQKQVGNGIGTLLASIGIPLIVDALKGGSGALRMGRSGSGGPRIGMPPMAPPPYIGTWGRGSKNKSRSGTPFGEAQPLPKYSNSGRHSLSFKKHIPMSNFDLLDWCKYLEIPINNVLSRDETVPHKHQQAIFIYNLEPSYMSGSHWVTSYVKDGTINYFDSFGMPPFQEMVNHAKERNLNLLHQNQQIQNLYTTTCGYFCLYFLNEMNKGNDYFDLLQVFSTDTDENEKFIEKYFKM